MDEKTLETQQVADEQLGDVVGGMRDNASLEARTREAIAADDEGEDAGLSPIFRCPKCGRSLRFCICPR